MNTLVVAQKDALREVSGVALIDAIEQSFAAYASGRTMMPPKKYLDLDQYNGDFRAMPAYVKTPEWDAAGIKWVNVHPDNPTEHELPTVMGVMVYSDPSTGYPLALLDGTELTRLRTGAAAAIATDYLAVQGATSLGIIGAGAQAYTQLEMISEVRPIQDVIVSDIDTARVQALVEEFEDDFDVREGSVQAAGHCDVLSTVTPVREPIVDPSDLGSHTHVNAMGADAEGKHEIANAVLKDAKIGIDDQAQAVHSGEINVPHDEGVIRDSDIHGELGDIVVGTIDGRTDSDGVTLFDSTGLAIQDVAAAHVVYTHAKRTGVGIHIDFVGE